MIFDTLQVDYRKKYVSEDILYNFYIMYVNTIILHYFCIKSYFYLEKMLIFTKFSMWRQTGDNLTDMWGKKYRRLTR